MPSPATVEDTRTKLISAAEKLFAVHGIDGVSLREINRVSGARNAVALQYHFEDRNGVVRAILAKHDPEIDTRRHAMLDQYEAENAPNLRAMAGALVRPLAAKLSDPDGGPEYLQILAHLMNRSDTGAEPPAPSRQPDSIQRWRSLMKPLLAEDATRLHRRFVAIRFAIIELGRRVSSGPHTDDRLFVSHLIDLVTAVLAAPVSHETLRLADDRDAKRNGRRPARVARKERP